jgi:histidinol-phosphate aminotransferase
LNILSLVKPTVRSLKAYEAKNVPCRIKLDANESPYNFHDIVSSLDNISLNRYPDPDAEGLKKILSEQMNIPHNTILCGNGSDELISYLIMTFGGPVLFPVPTFSMYSIIAQTLGEKRVAVELDSNFDIKLNKTIKALDREKPSLIFLSSPNNPTGNSFSPERIFTILKHTSTSAIVVVDEAYQPFSGQDIFLPQLRQFDNLVILRTLSKIGFASLRLGYMIAREEIIHEVNKVRLPFNVNSLSQTLAIAALKKSEEINKTVDTIKKEREFIFQSLSQIPDVTPYPSSANFILFRVKNAESIFREFLKKGILIRNIHSGISNCLRVTVGTAFENKIFVNTLKEIVNNERNKI